MENAIRRTIQDGVVVHAPLNQAGIIVSPRAHYLEDPPRVIGLKGVLYTRSTSQSEAETRVTFAVRNSYDAVLIRRGRRHNSPIKPTGFTARSAGLDVALPR